MRINLQFLNSKMHPQLAAKLREREAGGAPEENGGG
ncbi:unnamed protein product [Amoebophrya sp. A120]|nr:unnamed protein product [Amoebophrya sp. A120]|eukprot:GSA120T00014423001.1